MLIPSDLNAAKPIKLQAYIAILLIGVYHSYLVKKYSKFSSIYHHHWASQVVLVVKEPTCQCRRHRDVGSVPGSGRSPGGGHSNPLRYSCLENPRDREAWRATVHVVANSWTWLKRLSTAHHHRLQKYSSVNSFFFLETWQSTWFMNELKGSHLFGITHIFLCSSWWPDSQGQSAKI